jgi:hypothetical protein
VRRVLVASILLLAILLFAVARKTAMRGTIFASMLVIAVPAHADDASPLLNTTILEVKLGFYEPRVGDSPELGPVLYPWWTEKRGSVEIVNGEKGSGFRFGWGFTLGLAPELDFLNPTSSREAREDAGIHHFYLFGEFNDDFAANFAGAGINLGAVYLSFGIAFEF